MKLISKTVFTLSLLFIVNLVNADDKPVVFTDSTLEERYYELIDEIRCLVCQNQSLADSNADLAQDLRNEIYQMIIAGDNNEKIMTFLVERYGDFVLYRPPLQKNTWLLWFGPFLFLFLGLLIAIILIKKQSNENSSEISEEQQQRLSAILDAKSDGSKR